MNNNLILKTILYRIIALIFILSTTYVWFGNLSSSIIYTIFTAVISTILYYAYDLYWQSYMV